MNVTMWFHKCICIWMVCCVSVVNIAWADTSKEGAEVIPAELSEQEIDLGAKFGMLSDLQYLFSDDPGLTARLQGLVDEMQPNTTRAGVKYTVTVVDAPIYNAWVVHDGRIFMTRALVNLLRQDDLIAAVLAHEIAHVEGQHTVHAYKRAQTAATINLILSVAGSAFGVPTGWAKMIVGLLLLKFNRDEENEADINGIAHLEATHRDPVAMPMAMHRIRETQLARPLLSSDLFSTHPAVEDRVEERLADLQKEQLDLLDPLLTPTSLEQVVVDQVQEDELFERDVFPLVLYQSHRITRTKVAFVDLAVVMDSFHAEEKVEKAIENAVSKATKDLKQAREELDAVLTQHQQDEVDAAELQREVVYLRLATQRANRYVAGKEWEAWTKQRKRLKAALTRVADERQILKVYNLRKLAGVPPDSEDVTEAVIKAHRTRRAKKPPARM